MAAHKPHNACRNMKDTTVLIASKSPTISAEIENRLAANDAIRVIGTAKANEDIPVMTRHLLPDILVIHAPSCGEPHQELLSRLMRIQPDLKILALECSPEHIRSCFIKLAAWGLRGCICKWQDSTELIDAIYTVGNGDFYFCPVASHALLDAYRHMIHHPVGEEARA